VIATQLPWFVARSCGIVAWLLLAVSTFWGVALSSRFLGKRPKPNWMLDLHRFVSGLSVAFTIVHVGALAFDSYVPAGPVELLVPFAYPQHPQAVAWGVVAWYLLIAVEITSVLRSKIGRQRWRMVHYASFALFAFATVHLLTIGSDRSAALWRLTVMAVVVVIAGTTMLRIVMADERDASTIARGS
jgi:predicted ferric reductase